MTHVLQVWLRQHAAAYSAQFGADPCWQAIWTDPSGQYRVLVLEMEQVEVQPPEYNVSETHNIIHTLELIVNMLQTIVQQLMQEQQ